MERSLDLDCVRSFISVAKTLSFTRSAHLIGRTQSAVSMQIQRLERAIGGRLFERRSGAVMLTPRGVAFLPLAQQLLQASDEALDQLKNFDLAGNVRLGVCDDFAAAPLVDMLSRFRQAHTKVGLELTVNLSIQLLDGLDQGDFDLVVAKRPQAGPVRPSKLLSSADLVWVTGGPRDMWLDEPMPLVLFPERAFPRDIMISALDRMGRAWFVAATCHNLPALHASVAAGLGISAIASNAIEGGVRPVGPERLLPPLPRIETALFWREGILSPATHRLRKAIEITAV